MDRFHVLFLVVASVTAAGLAAAVPRRSLTTCLVLGATLFVAETLVHFGLLRAPYSASAGLPWVALVAYVPTLIGVGLGAAGRRLLG